jgi:ketosteroid isomerase-like protein
MPPFETLVDTSIDSAEVAWLVTKRAAAIRSRDAEYLASRYAPGASTFGVAPPLAASAGAARQVDWLRGWFDVAVGRVGYTVHGLTVSIAGDVALCRSHDVLSVQRAGHPRRAVRFETVLGLERTSGVWLVTVERLRLDGAE